MGGGLWYRSQLRPHLSRQKAKAKTVGSNPGPITGCVILGKLLSFSGPWFSHPCNGAS